MSTPRLKRSVSNHRTASRAREYAGPAPTAARSRPAPGSPTPRARRVDRGPARDPRSHPGPGRASRLDDRRRGTRQSTRRPPSSHRTALRTHLTITASIAAGHARIASAARVRAAQYASSAVPGGRGMLRVKPSPAPAPRSSADPVKSAEFGRAAGAGARVVSGEPWHREGFRCAVGSPYRGSRLRRVRRRIGLGDRRRRSAELASGGLRISCRGLARKFGGALTSVTVMIVYIEDCDGARLGVAEKVLGCYSSVVQETVPSAKSILCMVSWRSTWDHQSVLRATPPHGMLRFSNIPECENALRARCRFD